MIILDDRLNFLIKFLCVLLRSESSFSCVFLILLVPIKSLGDIIKQNYYVFCIIIYSLDIG